MERIAKLAALLGVGLRVEISDTGETWIGFSDDRLRTTPAVRGMLRVPGMTYGKDSRAAFENFLRSIRGRELSWPGHDITDDHSVRVPRNLRV